MMKLSVDRLFSSPPLAATLPADLKFSPDGRFIAWLQPAEDDRERLDLWRYELATGSRECWVNAKRLADQGEILSDAEKAERERRRVFSTGITRYEFDPGGEYVLIPADGTGYRLSVGSGELARFTPECTRQTDFTISPKGSFISFVRSGDLYCYDCDNG